MPPVWGQVPKNATTLKRSLFDFPLLSNGLLLVLNGLRVLVLRYNNHNHEPPMVMIARSERTSCQASGYFSGIHQPRSNDWGRKRKLRSGPRDRRAGFTVIENTMDDWTSLLSSLNIAEV